MADNLISGIRFEPDGVEVAYIQPGSDVRADGRLIATHTLWIADCPDYGEEIETVRRAAYALLADALEDHHSTDPVDLDQLQERDDDDDD